MSEEEREIAYKNGMTFGEEQQLYWKNEDYKSRCEKAIEYIGQYDGHIEGYYYSKEHKRFLVEENVKDDLLNILNGKK